MPDLGEGLTEAEIIEWLVTIGDHVSLNQILLTVESAKAVVELPSPYEGVITAIHHGAGEVVQVGEPIIVIATEGSPEAPTLKLPASQPQGDTSESQRERLLIGRDPQTAPVARRPRHPASTSVSTQTTSVPGEQARTSPIVRRLARELGVDLEQLTRNAPGNQVSRADVMTASARKAAAETSTVPDETRTPIQGFRKQTATAMVASAFTAPHVTEWLTVDVSRTLRLLRRARDEFAGLRVTPLTLVARATLLSIARHPEINAQWDGRADQIVRFKHVNLGIAVASPRGLIVPNIAEADTMPFVEFANALNSLIEEARANRTAHERLRSSTFTITNIGVYGADGGTPIINPGEAAILCLGQIKSRPWNHKGKVALRSLATLSLSFDHRLVDGELGSKFLTYIGRVLEHPDLALIS